MNFDVQCGSAPTEFNRLIGKAARRTDRCLAVKPFDVFRVEPHASVAHGHPDAPRYVRTMQAILRNTQFEKVMSFWIIRLAARDHMLSITVALEMFLVDVLGENPGRILHFARYMPVTDRSFPIEAAQTDGESVNDMSDAIDCGNQFAMPAMGRGWR